MPLWMLCSANPLFGSQQSEPQKILLLASYPPSAPVGYLWNRGMQSILESGVPSNVDLDIEYLDVLHFKDARYVQLLINLLRHKYAASQPDLVITVYNMAFDFMRTHGSDLFPEVPVVFAGVEKKFIKTRKLGPNITGVISVPNYAETLGLALRLHPDTQHVAVVSGAGKIGRTWSMNAMHAFQPYRDRVDFIDITGLPMPAILEKVATLPQQSLVMYITLLEDGAGNKFTARQSASQISRVANAPVYSFWDLMLGHGIVGGYLSSAEEKGKAAAALALRILNGEQPSDIPLASEGSLNAMFDWRELRRWYIKEDLLPLESIVKFKELSSWEKNQSQIIGGLVLIVLQGLFISYLLYQYRIRRKIEQRYRTVADYTYDWEYWENDDGSLEYVSLSCERISGYTIQEFKTAPSLFKDIILPEDRELQDIHAQKSTENEGPSDIQFRIKRKDGQIRWIENVCQPVKTNQGDHLGIRGSNRDITERKLAEINAQKRREELTYISRVTTLGELSASMAHELNQPLAAILNNANAAMKFISGDLKDLDEVNEILNDIIKDDRRASGIIKKLRTLMSKKEMGFSPLNLNEIIWGVAKLTDRETSARDVPLILELDDDLPHVKGDAIHLEQIILNLILNGTEAMVTIDRQFRKLRICTTEHDRDFIKVSVEDKGTGIDEAHINSIFETFYTTKPGGMGMGLSICRSIIEAHGGRLWAENNPDKGATVYFTVPVFMGDEA